MPYSIMLDAGHGGRDPGAVYKGRMEKEDALKLTLAIGEILQESGLDVEYTRTTDIYETPFQKAMEANNAGADFFVSIHRNSVPGDNSASGVLSLVYDLDGIKYEMAMNINEQLAEVGYENLGVDARPNLVVLKRTRMPSVLVEVGFINSDEDNKMLDSRFDQTAQAIADGILETLGMTDGGGMAGGAPQEEEDTEEEQPGEDQAEEDWTDMDQPDDNKYFWVQTGLFRSWDNAQKLLWELLGDGFPAAIADEGSYISVRVGGFDNLAAAVDMEHRLRRAGYETIIVR